MSANMATSHDTPATQKHTNAHSCTAGHRERRGRGEGTNHLVLREVGRAG